MSKAERLKIEEFIGKAKDLLRFIENNEVVSKAVGYKIHILLDINVQELGKI